MQEALLWALFLQAVRLTSLVLITGMGQVISLGISVYGGKELVSLSIRRTEIEELVEEVLSSVAGRGVTG